MSSGSAPLFDSLARDRGERLSNDPDVLRGELAALGFADPAMVVAAHRRLALGAGPVVALAGGASGVRGDAARRCFGAIAAGPDPDRALNRFADIVERLSSGVNLYRLLEARPRAGRPCSR